MTFLPGPDGGPSQQPLPPAIAAILQAMQQGVPRPQSPQPQSQPMQPYLPQMQRPGQPSIDIAGLLASVQAYHQAQQQAQQQVQQAQQQGAPRIVGHPDSGGYMQPSPGLVHAISQDGGPTVAHSAGVLSRMNPAQMVHTLGRAKQVAATLQHLRQLRPEAGQASPY